MGLSDTLLTVLIFFIFVALNLFTILAISIKKIKDNWYKTNRIHGTFGYLLNKKGAKKILDIFPIKYQIDTALYLASRNNKINSYIYEPQLIFHYNYSESNIQINPKTLQDDNI